MSDDYDDPRRDVVEGSCIWCKKTPAEAAPDTPFEEVGRHEIVCGACLEDLRGFKRSVGWQIVISDAFPEDVAREATEAAYRALREALSKHYDDVPLEPKLMKVSNAARQEDPNVD